MRRCLVLIVAAFLVRCTSDACQDDAASVEVTIAGDLAQAASISIVIAYDDVTRTLPINVEGTTVPPERVGLIPEPSPGADLRVTVHGFSRVDGRGARVSTGEATVTVTPDGCNAARVDLEALDVEDPRDGGVEDPRDGGVEDPRDAGDADPDAGVRDAGDDPRDGGVEPPLTCNGGITRDSVLLYDFDNLPTIQDQTQLTEGRWVGDANGNGPQPHAAPEGCGTALDLDGSGVVVVAAADGLTIAGLELLLHLHGEGANEAQGIVSRDETGQAEPGHFTLFRTCDDYLVLRVQDLMNSVYLCSDQPLQPETWSRVRVIVSPEPALFLDGVEQSQADQVGLFGVGCGEPVECGGTLQLEPQASGLPLVIGASAHEAAAGSEDAYTRPFFGAVDHVHGRSR